MLPSESRDPFQTTARSSDPDPSAATRDAPAPSEASQATVTRLPSTGSFVGPGGAAFAVRPSVPGYEILDVLGRGGMGVVYKARHLALKRTVALKMVLAGGHAGPNELARFRTEAEAVARLQHPNIVQIHEVGEADGHPFCALEFVEGGTLAGKLDGPPLSFREAAVLMETLAWAMQAAHARHVIHRDLKPANVLLTADGAPKITDFGLARQLDTDSSATQAGAVMGTPSYMAPEQASGRAHEAGPPADVYALGAILYECLTGKPPFRGNSVADTLVQVQTVEPVPPSRVRAGAPRDLETICLKAMAKEPSRRYATAGDLADDLRRYLADEPIHARRVGAGERIWRRVRRNPVVAGLTVAVLALAVVAGVFASRPRPEPAAAVAPPPEADTSADDLPAVVAELDRTDPGWRLDEMERKRPEIPAAENGAGQMAKFRQAADAIPERQSSPGNWWRPEIADRLDAILALPPDAAVPADDVELLVEELARVEELVGIARKMADFPRGRFTNARTRDVVSTLLPDHMVGRGVARLLEFDTLMQLRAGNRAQALANFRAIWNVGRIYQGDPIGIAQQIRLAVIRMALRGLARSLATGDCPDADLAAVQSLLDEAARVPAYQTMMRSDRGMMHYFLSGLGAGDVPDPDVMKALGFESRDQLPSGKEIRRTHVWLLRYMTEAVGIAGQPPEQWAALLGPYAEKLAAPPHAGNKLAALFTTDPFAAPTDKRGQASVLAANVLVHLAELRSASAALAVERYRLARGAWPNALSDLVPAYLAAVPGDPHDGKPIRYRRTEVGVVIYSVGPDGTDNHGTLSTVVQSPAGTDVGFRLWNADRRPPNAGKP